MNTDGMIKKTLPKLVFMRFFSFEESGRHKIDLC